MTTTPPKRFTAEQARQLAEQTLGKDAGEVVDRLDRDIERAVADGRFSITWINAEGLDHSKQKRVADEFRARNYIVEYYGGDQRDPRDTPHYTIRWDRAPSPMDR